MKKRDVNFHQRILVGKKVRAHAGHAAKVLQKEMLTKVKVNRHQTQDGAFCQPESDYNVHPSAVKGFFSIARK